MLADRLRDTPILICGTLEVCLAAACFALWRAASDFRIFKLMGLSLAITSIHQFWRYFGGNGADWVFSVFTAPLIVAAAAESLGFRRRRWTLLFWPVYLLTLLLGWTENGSFVRSWAVDASQLALGFLLVETWRKPKGRNRWIVGAVALYFMMRWTVSAEVRGWMDIPRYFEWNGWRWYFTTPALILFGVVTLTVYARELLADRREKLRMASEQEAGRAVQKMLLPARQPASGLWRIDSVYVPAPELGGDFHALLDRPDDSSMLVIGDVSGKGLRAAMVVSTILGALRQDPGGGPAEVLSRLNRTLLELGFGGFATCLCVVLGAKLEMRLANAGHPVPYLNGAEIDLPGALPLGIVADADYVEQTVELSPGDRALFVSNGVVEAQNKSGDLFGLQRMRLLSRLAPAEIVAAAQRFGQKDDITVVSLTRLAPKKDAAPATEATAIATHA